MEWTNEFTERLAQGYPDAYEELVRLEWSQAVRTAWFILRNVHDAEEAAQEAFLSFYRNRNQLRDPRKVRSWLYRILVNSARQQGRRRKSHVEWTDELALEADLTSDPIQAADRRLILHSALKELSEDERTAVVLSYYTGLTDTEAATAAGWNLGKYKYRLAAGRRHLSRLMLKKEASRLHKEGFSDARG
ncbi:RNA polymerase sigma factor [Alicyclobacillus dauci]|uniref:RNA polymerase sigma factor n=1 Tax=Alicyclobacillus dauci TaxID=1475485 RepID=A0ABY6Z4K7_9BACL|nr:RNA polymerase sigma factor [Alicyclobacillus dauci]WAH37214.1 RNA polymerase sigma factor [Alicyclobacillus dauci]